MSKIKDVKEALVVLSSPKRKRTNEWFFKTGKGEYGEGDIFIGVRIPDIRKVVKAFYREINLPEIKKLITSKIHEERMCALLILVSKFEKTKEEKKRKSIVDFYLQHRKFINNWDLVDASCHKILGRFCFENKNDEILFHLANEDDLWSKRIAIVSTMYHLKKGELDLTPEIALKNLYHEHDLMHKANGWLLREMGKKDEEKLFIFLKNHYQKMPRTCLRYAIEKLDEDLRQDFLKGKI